MKTLIRRSDQRGLAEHGWLHSRHSFSFANYHDPRFMGFGALRVINEDQIEGGTGFGTHPHADMEIVSYVIEGGLEHKDSMGNTTIIRPGEIQKMSAGTGVRHSEYNLFKDKKTHFLQIWILPDKAGYHPSYGQLNFAPKLAHGDFIKLASRTGSDDTIALNQDVDIYVGKATKNMHVHHGVRANRKIWLQVISGHIALDFDTFTSGDGVGIEDAGEITMDVADGSEFLLFDLP